MILIGLVAALVTSLVVKIMRVAVAKQRKRNLITELVKKGIIE